MRFSLAFVLAGCLDASPPAATPTIATSSIVTADDRAERVDDALPACSSLGCDHVLCASHAGPCHCDVDGVDTLCTPEPP